MIKGIRTIFFLNRINLNHLDMLRSRSQTEIKPVPARMSNIDFPKLLERFKRVQENHREYKKAMRAKDISSLDKDICNLEI